MHWVFDDAGRWGFAGVSRELMAAASSSWHQGQSAGGLQVPGSPSKVWRHKTLFNWVHRVEQDFWEEEGGSGVIQDLAGVFINP